MVFVWVADNTELGADIVVDGEDCFSLRLGIRSAQNNSFIVTQEIEILFDDGIRKYAELLAELADEYDAVIKCQKMSSQSVN